MPYSFRDTDSAVDNYVLPSEALQINGNYIEELFAQDLTLSATYETTRVQGRELSAQEAQEIEVGVRHGSFLASRRFKPRKIVVQYKLEASSNEHFRNAFNKLNEILNFEDAQLIFADEPDKYFVGTVTEVDEVEPGRNAVFGEFSITCFDPFKYSVEEYTVEPTNDTFLLNYDGTMTAYPKFETDFSADCGYVAFLDDSNKVIQIGNPEQKDGIVYPSSQILLNHKFTTLNGWTANAGVSVEPSAAIHTGSYVIKTEGNTKRAWASDVGTGQKWHGPSLYRRIPPDQAGDYGSDNWRASFGILFAPSNAEGWGVRDIDLHCEAHILDRNKTIIAGILIDKNIGENTSMVRLYAGDSRYPVELYEKVLTTPPVSPFSSGSAEGYIPGNVEIQKSANTITFNFGHKRHKGCTYKFSYKSSGIDQADGISLYTGVWRNYYKSNYNGFGWVKFIRDDCTTWKDIPNIFSEGDSLEADTSNAGVYLNGLEHPELGALGNQWEGFGLKPGTNQVGISWSAWAVQPTFRMKYRKVYI